ncbi:hypothetical protein SOCE26_055830 [Sorangium cellulosum]|uniref:Secreted protein n=1 Tax=Sorangium cellulosum TaxID=56 RepID=A0A2L0EXT3_SORCE|nr:hypothetical protein [Sorangium cellulosum]AUX44121.1 hypothetical protein SOCE26_055830 [Sorangium cellulosum]
MDTHNTAPPAARRSPSPRAVRGFLARGAALRASAVALRALAAAATFAAVSAPPAGASAEEPSAAGVDLVVEDAPWTLDPEAVRAAVGRELGGPVALAPAKAAGRPTLVLRGEPDGRVTLIYSAEDGRHIGRTIDLPEDPGRAAEAIALLAGNLVRDEAAELAAALGKRPGGPSEAPPAAAPPPSAARARPASRPPARASAAEEPAPCAADGARVVLFGADAVPFLGTSTITGTNVVRRYSLNFVGGYTAGIAGAEVSVGFNIASSFLCGAQFSNAANIVTGPARGAQMTFGLNFARSLSGAQIGSLNVAAGPADGAQIGVANLAGPVDGAQIGSLNVAVGPVVGAQIGVANVAGPVDGAQISTLNVAAGAGTGAQIGVANVAAGESIGTQIGAVNIARGKVGGAQIGVINYADESSFSLGVLNFIRKGRYHLDVWGQESGIVMAGLKHGSDHIHNVYGLGVRLAGDRPLATFAVGLGGRISVSEHVYADIDVLGYGLHDLPSLEAVAAISQARALLGVRLSEDLAIFGGPTYNLSFGKTDEDVDLSPYGSTAFPFDGVNAMRGWPGATLGVQVF